MAICFGVRGTNTEDHGACRRCDVGIAFENVTVDFERREAKTERRESKLELHAEMDSQRSPRLEGRGDG